MKDIIFCKTCLTSSARPRVEFDNNGICNACLYAVQKKEIDWKARSTQFDALIHEIKEKSSGSYDCIVPWSGGKDSSSIAYKLKFEFGLNPLLVTFSPLIKNECGVFNRELLIKKGKKSVPISIDLEG